MPYQLYLFQIFTVLSYMNSMVNPCLYAFTNENFRESFINAFKCAGDIQFSSRRPSEMASHVGNNNCHNGSRKNTSKKVKEANDRAKYEFKALKSAPQTQTENTLIDTTDAALINGDK